MTQKLYFFPDLNDPGEYRATFNFGTVTKISKWLGWQNAFGDIYVTNPPAGAKQNDILSHHRPELLVYPLRQATQALR